MKIIGAILLVFILYSCGETDTSKAKEKTVVTTEKVVEKVMTNTDWKRLEEEMYFIEYPQDWSLGDKKEEGPVFMLFSSLESKEDIFRENVNLMLEDIKGSGVDLDEYAKLSAKQIAPLLKDVNALKSEKLENHNGTYYRMVYTGTQQGLDLKWVQHYWLHNEMTYILTLTVEESKYEQYIEVANKIMNSFTLKI